MKCKIYNSFRLGATEAARELEATRGLGRTYFSIGRLRHMHVKYLRYTIGLGVDAIGVCKNGSQCVGLQR